jgi:hypothetical protein
LMSSLRHGLLQLEALLRGDVASLVCQGPKLLEQLGPRQRAGQLLVLGNPADENVGDLGLPGGAAADRVRGDEVDTTRDALIGGQGGLGRVYAVAPWMRRSRPGLIGPGRLEGARGSARPATLAGVASPCRTRTPWTCEMSQITGARRRVSGRNQPSDKIHSGG